MNTRVDRLFYNTGKTQPYKNGQDLNLSRNRGECPRNEWAYVTFDIGAFLAEAVPMLIRFPGEQRHPHRRSLELEPMFNWIFKNRSKKREGGVRSALWDAARGGARLANWTPASTSFLNNVPPDVLVRRAEDLHRNNPWARLAVACLTHNTVRAGIKPHPQIADARCASGCSGNGRVGLTRPTSTAGTISTGSTTRCCAPRSFPARP